MKAIRCMIYRGGTSKGPLIDGSLLPPIGEERDRALLALMGGSDAKQIDGLGGGTTTTSKVAIVSPSEREGVDVDYTLAQVVVGKGIVDYRANCGNMSSAVGPFAIEQGWVKPTGESTTVRIFNTNTSKIIVSRVPTDVDGVVYDGDYAIAGVQGTGSRITLEFEEPQGASTGKLLPTGNPADRLNIPELGEVQVSIVDASNLFVFIPAAALGIQGNESVSELQTLPGLQDKIELIRGMAAEKLGYVDDYHKAREESISVPKTILVAPPMAYRTTAGKEISEDAMDITARMISAMKPHPTMAMTGAMCLAAAAAIRGSVVNEIVPCEGDVIDRMIRLAQPGGLMEVGIKAEAGDCFEGGVHVKAAVGYRTTRKLMCGEAYIR